MEEDQVGGGSETSLSLSDPDFWAVTLPKIDFPTLSAATGGLSKPAEHWRKIMQPLNEIGEALRRQMEALEAALAPLVRELQWAGHQLRQCKRLEREGWLPHRTSPFYLVELDDLKDEELGSKVTEFYQDNWDDISSSLMSGIGACDFDQEAKDCFHEAVKAHRAGFYRCVPRLLFPEIERVARIELHGGALDKMASQDRLVAAIGNTTPVEMWSAGIPALRFYKKLTEHLYSNMHNVDRVAVAAADSVPNRHAAVHGFVSYTSFKTSLNSLLVADYLFLAISAIKRLSRKGDQPEATVSGCSNRETESLSHLSALSEYVFASGT